MSKLAFILLTVGACLALSSASCGPTCPAGQQSCGSSNPGVGDAGATGGDAVTCDLLTAVRKCMKDYCATATNPFCTCFKRGYDIDSGSCKCIDLDTKTLCGAEANGASADRYDCAADSSRVSSICISP